MSRAHSRWTTGHRRPRAGATLLASGVVAVLAGGCLGDAPIITSDGTRRLALLADSAQAWNAPSGSGADASEYEPITLRFEVPSRVARNQPLAMRLTLHNAGKAPIPLGLRSGRTYDVVVAMVDTRADSGAVWSLEGDAGAVTGSTPLAAGRDTTFTFAWTGQDDMGRAVPPGRYRARARMSAQYLRAGELWTAWAPFEVTATP